MIGPKSVVSGLYASSSAVVAPQLETAHLRDRIGIKLAGSRYRKADGQGVVGRGRL
jgi:hypothetical protein